MVSDGQLWSLLVSSSQWWSAAVSGGQLVSVVSGNQLDDDTDMQEQVDWSMLVVC